MQTRLILFGAAVATGVGFWLQVPYGVIVLGLALAYAAFERGVQIGERLAVAREDAARAVVALADRLTKIENEVSKIGLADRYKAMSRGQG